MPYGGFLNLCVFSCFLRTSEKMGKKKSLFFQKNVKKREKMGVFSCTFFFIEKRCFLGVFLVHILYRV